MKEGKGMVEETGGSQSPVITVRRCQSTLWLHDRQTVPVTHLLTFSGGVCLHYKAGMGLMSDLKVILAALAWCVYASVLKCICQCGYVCLGISVVPYVYPYC